MLKEIIKKSIKENLLSNIAYVFFEEDGHEEMVGFDTASDAMKAMEMIRYSCKKIKNVFGYNPKTQIVFVYSSGYFDDTLSKSKSFEKFSKNYTVTEISYLD